MEKRGFFIKLAIFGLVLVSVYAFALWNLSDGYVDHYYPKFTHEAGSLILGDSRAQEGIMPSVIEDELPQYSKPVLNFAFKLAQSSYGPVYLKAIKKKLKKDNRGGLFIIAVTPANLAIHESMDDIVDDKFDTFSILNRIDNFNSDPNFDYIRKFYSKSLYKGFLEVRDPMDFQITHDDGWLETPLKTERFELGEKEIKAAKLKLLRTYAKHVGSYRPSNVRVEYLKKTIELLKEHGQVVLVRMPADPEVRIFENQLQEDFEEAVTAISEEHKVPYITYLPNDGQYKTYDGSHLAAEGAYDFTHSLCEIIKTDLRTTRIRAN